MQDGLRQSQRLRRDLTQVIRDVVREETKDCFRLRKAITVSMASANGITVHFVGDEKTTQQFTLPYSSKIQSVPVGTAVWVAIIYGSMRNAIVWETADFQ